MAYQSEQEQVEALKRWWRENGTAILAGVVLAGGAVFGWQGWQKQQKAVREGASIQYENLMEAYENASAGESADKDHATLVHVATQMREEYAKTTYAQYAALQMARYQVEQGDLVKARSELDWILASKPEPEIRDLVHLRLAQVLHAQGNPDKAIELLEDSGSETQAVAYLELRGDILLGMERKSEARDAYESAMQLAEQNGERRPLLEMKLDNLAENREET